MAKDVYPIKGLQRNLENEADESLSNNLDC